MQYHLVEQRGQKPVSFADQTARDAYIKGLDNAPYLTFETRADGTIDWEHSKVKERDLR